MILITEKQQDTLDYISEYLEDNGYPPSRMDIALNFDIAVNAAQERLKAIEKKGYITISPGVGRGIKIIKKAA